MVRWSERPPLTFSILCNSSCFQFLGLAQILGYAGIQHSSPMLSTAMLNLIPAFTIILSITFSWILGGIFLATEAFLISALYILLALTFRKFPATHIIVSYPFYLSTVLFSLFSLIVVPHPSAWKLRLDMGLVAMAVFGPGLSVSLCTWCVSTTGPFYVSMFKPLAIVFAVVMDIIPLGNTFCLGSLIGAVTIVTGFYAVMWGKAREEKTTEHNASESSDSSSEEVPLLQNRKEDMKNRASA